MSALREMRIKARRAGIEDARSMSLEELEDALGSVNGKAKKGKGVKAKKAAKATKVVKRGPGRPKKVVEDEDEAPKAKRGRPKGSKSAKTVAKKTKKVGRPAKPVSEKKTVKKGKVGRPLGSGNGTRILVPSEIDWNADFNFREGSTSQYILNQLRKSANKYDETADVRADTMDKLIPKVGTVDELVFVNRATGKPHKGDKAEEMLKYRVHRTIFDYARLTGQHDGNGSASKPSKKAKSVKGKVGRPKGSKSATEAPKAKRGRPKGSTKAKAEVAPKKRGRPPGTKNKKSKK